MIKLRSALVWVATWLYMAMAGVVALPWMVWTGRMGFTYAVARGGSRLLLALAGVRVVVEGTVPSAGGAAPIFMSNHQSNLDPPILLAHLPGFISFLAKRELFAVPVLGSVLRAGGLIAVDRSDRASAQASIAQAAAAVRAGRPFLIFPEGTRTRDGQLQPFKKGPFYLAEQSRAPIIPITIAGSGGLMPPGTWRIRPGRVQVRVHPPVLAADWAAAADPRAACAALVKARMEAGLDNYDQIG